MSNDRIILKSNSGVSLVEMIVVVAIMAVLVGVTSLGVGMLSKKSATQCASNIEICLNRCRTHTMGKTSGLVGFVAESDGIYYIEKYDYGSNKNLDDSSVGEYTKKKIGKKDVTVTCNGKNLLVESATIAFNRSDGSVKSVTPSSTSKVKSVITVEKGSRVYTVEINHITGKVERIN